MADAVDQSNLARRVADPDFAGEQVRVVDQLVAPARLNLGDEALVDLMN